MFFLQDDCGHVQDDACCKTMRKQKNTVNILHSHRGDMRRGVKCFNYDGNEVGRVACQQHRVEICSRTQVAPPLLRLEEPNQT